MKNKRKKQKKKVGSAPGSLIYVGEKKSDEARITFCQYNEDRLSENDIDINTVAELVCDDSLTNWLNINGLHDVSVIEKIGAAYDIHPLVLEDILNTENRSKFEEYEDFLFFIIKHVTFHSDTQTLNTENVNIIVKENTIITLQEGKLDVFEPVRERLRVQKGRIRKSKVDYLIYALLDLLIDHYFTVIDKIEDKTEIVDEELTSSPTSETLQRIYSIKKEIHFIRKYFQPIKTVVQSLSSNDSEIFSEQTVIFIRDVLDHSHQIHETLETLRETIISMLDTYLSIVSFRMNNVMKFLTIVATIFIPLTFIAGIYGMNFKFMPELEWRWAYPTVWIVMIIVGIGMVIYFKRKDWL